MKRLMLAIALLAILAGQALPLAAGESVTIVKVKPSKVRYLFGEDATAQIMIKNDTDSSQKGTLVLREEWDLTESRQVASVEVTLNPGEEKSIPIKWNVGNVMYGRALRATFLQNGKEVAGNVEFFQVAGANNWFRTMIINGGGIADRPARDTDPFVTYVNYDNHFAYAASDFARLAPEEDVWYGGQTGYYREKKQMIEDIKKRAKSMGIRSGAYTNSSTGGVAGYELARQHPEWCVRNERGAFLFGWKTGVSPIDLSRTTKDRMTAWYALMPDFGDPDVVRFGAEEVIRAIEMFGWDAVFFDGGAYSTHHSYPIMTGQVKAGFTWDGKPVERGWDPNELDVQIARRVRDIIRKAYPDVAIWYNDVSPRDPRNYKQVIAMLDDSHCGGLYELQGVTLLDPKNVLHHWENLYLRYVGDRDELWELWEAGKIKAPVLCSGYMYNYTMSKAMSEEEFAACRDTWTMANHIGSFFIAAAIHPCWLGTSGFRPAAQFMTRYSAFLWADDIKLMRDPWRRITVESNREVWWEKSVYVKQTRDYEDTLIHLVNSPEKGTVDPKVSSDPPPAEFVEVARQFYSYNPRGRVRVWALRMYDYDSTAKEPVQVELKPEFDGNKLIVEVPPFKYHTLLVIRWKKR